MKFLILTSILALAAIASPVEAATLKKRTCPAKCPSDMKTHVIVDKDICYDLASAAGMSVASLKAANKGVDCDKLQIGSKLCLRIPKCDKTHVVVKDDNCDAISKKYGMTLQELKSQNPDADCANLQITFPLCVKNCDKSN